MISQVRRPIVSIGLPVYNGEKTLSQTLDSLLKQSFEDYEIIISDNASSDSTAEICHYYAQIDSRIRYIRQNRNIGAELNFKFVLNEAQGKYFTWVAADDLRSINFLGINVDFLELNPDYLASTSPNCYITNQFQGGMVTFALDGCAEDRVVKFLSLAWSSHAIFYSVIRTEELKKCKCLGQSFLGADWAINVDLAVRGKINRTTGGHILFGSGGVSHKSTIWRNSRVQLIEFVAPFYQFSRYTISLTRKFPVLVRFKILVLLLRLNIQAERQMVRTEISTFYINYVRPILVNLRLKR